MNEDLIDTIALLEHLEEHLLGALGACRPIEVCIHPMWTTEHKILERLTNASIAMGELKDHLNHALDELTTSRALITRPT